MAWCLIEHADIFVFFFRVTTEINAQFRTRIILVYFVVDAASLNSMKQYAGKRLSPDNFMCHVFTLTAVLPTRVSENPLHLLPLMFLPRCVVALG